MAQSLGTFCLVLHGHLPYVLRHGSAPHGEAWLFEAMAETYLPLLDLIGEVALNGVTPAITIGLTPILLEQLADERAKAGFLEYVRGRMVQAREDQAQFRRLGDTALADMAGNWEKWYQAKLDHFERIDRDIPKQFALRQAEGHVQILGSAATHAYLPLLLTDQAVRAQLAVGAAVSRRILGTEQSPSGLWLPECAYRPGSDSWHAPVLDAPGRYRPGIESFLSAVGADHTFLDSHQIAGGQPLGLLVDKRFFAANPTHINRDQKSGWRESLEPIGLSSNPERAEVFAMARHPSLAHQVWSNKVGYPGDGCYLEFHKKHGSGGLRYWRVTDVTADLLGKEPYDPNAVEGRAFAHAQHFCTLLRKTLTEYQARTGRRGVCVAAFDAELFGHWWFEGPRFLRDVILTLAQDERISRLTAQAALAQNPPEKVMRAMEGSWGREGGHAVWLNDSTRWMWEVEHRAEKMMVDRVQVLPWQTNPMVAEALSWAGRELMLLQASDWPFVVENRSALDYGIKRFCGHSTRFDRAIDIATHIASGKTITPLQTVQLEEMKAHDPVLKEISLQWWQ